MPEVISKTSMLKTSDKQKKSENPCKLAMHSGIHLGT